jgi:hypothetical protein
MRLTTGIGIAVGGVGGAIAALMGAPQNAPAPRPAIETPSPPVANTESTTAEATTAEALGSAASAPPSASAPTPEAPAPASASTSLAPAPAPLALPTTREALLKSMMLCDQKKDFDECTRVSQALELGTTGPSDPEGAKRFRKISLTHLVMQCETGNSPHACFVLAAKYRAGTELAANPAGAMALEKRALELCRFSSAPECPAAPAP